MTGLETYCLYVSLKSHFSKKSHDFFKYGAKISNFSSYESRRDKYKFEKLAKKHPKDMVDFLVSNIIRGKEWVGDFLEEDAEDNHREFQKRKEGFTYYFKQEVQAAFDSVDTPQELFRIPANQFPPLLLLHLSGDVSLEVLSALNSLVGFKEKFDRKLDDPLWTTISLRMEKILPFLNCDKKQLVRALRDIVPIVA